MECNRIGLAHLCVPESQNAFKKMESGGRPGFGTAAAKPALSIVVFPHSVTEIFWSLASL